MKALFHENMKTATSITSPDDATGTVLTNLYTRQLASYAEFVMPGSTMTLNITFPANVEFTAIGIAGHNFGEGSSIEVTGVGIDSINTITGVAIVPRTVATTVQIKVIDPTASPGDDRIIGRLEIGEALTFPAISDTIKLSRVSASSSLMSATRQSYGYRGVTYTKLAVQIPVVEQNEVAGMRAFYDYVDTYIPFFLLFDEPCFTQGDLYCILENMAEIPFQLNDAHFYSSKIEVAEVF